MSNPSRAPRETVENIDETKLMPDCHLPFIYEPKDEKTNTNAWDKHCKALKGIGTLQKGLEGLDMEIAEPFTIPRELCCDKTMKAAGDLRAQAKAGKLSTRPRTDHARDILNVGYRLLPEELRRDVAAKARDTALADGGAGHTFGRLAKAYPKKGSTIPKPITELEAKVVWMEEVGHVLNNKELFEAAFTEEERTRLPFYDEVGDGRAVKMNVNAGNGFPVMSNIKDDEAKVIVLRLARRIREELEAAHASDPVNGVEKWLRETEQTEPWLVACLGKAKADFYTAEKIEKDMLRFYIAMGRQVAINIQTATQLLDQHAQSVLDHPNCRSASGVSMNHGGAERLVNALERQLYDGDEAHVRMGDDSWVIILIGNHLLMFALDGSNFDLTLHRVLTEAVHKRIKLTVALYDEIAAQLQYCYFRQRQVVTGGTLVRTWRHGGVSGMQTQPKVNGTVMGTGIRRTTERVSNLSVDEISEDRINEIIAGVGVEMGLTIKVEQYSFTEIPHEWHNEPLRFVLQQKPFLFLGYHFYLENGVLSVHSDIPRSMSQMRYPKLKWVDKENLEPMELGRLASTLLGMGRPTVALAPAYNALKEELLGRISRYTRSGERDFVHERFRWAVSVGAQEGIEETTLSSLKGIAGALSRSWDENWLEPRGVPSISSAEESVDSPLQVRESDAILDRLKESVKLDFKRAVPSRRPTKKTDGRNPNTKVFVPALPPKPKASRAHENQGWERSRRSEAQADDWAAERVRLEEEERALVKSELDRIGEDLPADEMDEDRFGEELTGRELEEYLDNNRQYV